DSDADNYNNKTPRFLSESGRFISVSPASRPMFHDAGQHTGSVGKIQLQSPDCADTGCGHHRLQLPLRIRAPLRGAEQHVERKERRKQRTFHIVVENELLHHEHAARLQCRHGPPQRDGTAVGSLAVQDMRQPGYVETAGNIVADEISLLKRDPVAEAEGVYRFFGKTPGRGEIVYGSSKPGVCLTEMDRIGTGSTPQIEEAPSPLQIYGGNDARGNQHGKVEHPHFEAFPLGFITVVRDPSANRCATPDGFVEAGPSGHEVMVMHDDMPQVTGRGAYEVFGSKWRCRITVTILCYQSQRREGVQQHFQPAHVAGRSLCQFGHRTGM